MQFELDRRLPQCKNRPSAPMCLKVNSKWGKHIVEIAEKRSKKGERKLSEKGGVLKV